VTASFGERRRNIVQQRDVFIAQSVQQRILTALAANNAVDGAMSILAQSVPLQDLTSGQTKNQNTVAGIPTKYPNAFGPLTTVDGTPALMSDLGANQVYLNQKAGDALNAHAGDTLQIYVGNLPVRVTVRAILKNENLASGALLTRGISAEPTILAPLEHVQAVIGLPGAVTQILVSNRGGLTDGYALSDAVTTQLRVLLAKSSAVASVQALLQEQSGKTALAKLIKDQSGGLKTKLQSLQTQVPLAGQSDQLTNLLSDSDVVDSLASMQAPIAFSKALNDALASISDYHVEPLKKNGLDAADTFGTVFTSFFVGFSLFSIAAGVMLIFLIFVMLAAERRSEMGMARAIGTQRRHLVQQFLFEGYAYDLGSAIVGLVLGIGVGLGMVQIMAALIGKASVDFSLVGHIEPRSLVVAFCLGALVTLCTVVFSSVRASRLNVVAAIRDLPEEFGIKTDAGHAIAQTIKEFAAIRKSPVRLILWLLVIPAVLLLKFVGIAYLGLRLLWYIRHLLLAFFGRGPLLVIVGVLLVPLGLDTKQQVFFSVGWSLALIGIAMLLRWIMLIRHVTDPIRNRIGYSLAGLSLIVFWLLPFDFWSRFGVPSLNAGPEMFFLAGILLVMGAVWTVMYNVDLLLGAMLAIFGSIGQLAPVIKMAVIYPMQHKFRTGLTLSMFSLVIFTLMFMSVIVGSASSTLNMNRDTGGFQVYGASNPNNPIQNAAHIVAANLDLKGVSAQGAMAKIAVSVRQPGQTDQSWHGYLANLLDDSYLASTQFTLHSHAMGYTSDAQVWQTLRTKPGYAVIDPNLIADKKGNSTDNGFALAGLYYSDSNFTLTIIQVRDTSSGKMLSLRVIGVLDQRAGNLSEISDGIYTGQNSFMAAGIPVEQPNFYVFRVAPGVDVHATALALGRTFLRNGLDIKESQKEFDTVQSVSIGLFNLLEGFMGLGLVVGIAALGVIATRAVVERRQEIGMMRAIGFQRAMVRTTFLLESSFVALLGTVLGVTMGFALARNFVDSVAQSNTSISLHIPWLQIAIIVAISYLASLLTTYLPAWQASRIYPSEALRYE